MNNQKRKARFHRAFIGLLLAALLMLMMSGCKSGSHPTGEYYDTADVSSTAMASADAASEENGSEAGLRDTAGSESSQTSQEGAAGNLSSTDIPEALTDAKLIYEAYFSVDTTDFEASQKKVTELVSSYEGYVESSSVDNYDTYRYAQYVVRIPADKYSAFKDQAGKIGSVTSFQEDVMNVSNEYYDIQGRLDSAEAEMETLRSLLKEAQDMSDIVTIQQAINDEQYEIDNLQGNLNWYDQQISYSTVTIHLNEVSEINGQKQAPIGFGQQMKEAFKTGTENIVRACKNLALSFGRHYLLWIIFVVIVVLAVLVIRRFTREERLNGKKLESGASAMNGRLDPMTNGAAASQEAEKKQKEQKEEKEQKESE